MKVIHTSDWHLGARLGRHDRHPDHVDAIRGLLALAEAEAPDLVVHTGDLFDATRPPYAALDLGLQALGKLATIAPTVVLCGNHDSPALFRSLDRLAQLLSPRRLWFLSRPTTLGFEIDGRRVGLACVPFIAPAAIADVAGGEIGAFEGSYADGIASINDELLDAAEAEAGPKGVVLYAAHLHVHGAVPGRSEKRMSVGDDYATHVNGLHRAVYAAFGHIHDPQLLPGGTVTGRYAGSLIPIDFGEQHQTKQAVVIDIDRDVVVRTEQLPGGRPLTRIDGTLDDLLAAAADGGLDGHLLKARVLSDDPIPDLVDQLLAASPGCVVFDLVNVVANRAARPVDPTSEPGDEPSLADLFGEWRATAANVGQRRAPDDAVVALLTGALGADGDAEVDLGTTAATAEVGRALEALRGA